jgi:hypothetical protein
VAKESIKRVIHGEEYTLKKGKWMSGNKEATPSTAAMLDIILKELDPQGDEEVESFVGTANIVNEGKEQEESFAEQQAKEDAHDRKEKAQEEMEESPPPAEVEKENLEPIKPQPIDTSTLKAEPPEAPREPESVKPEPITFGKDKYTFNEKTQKWMSGKKEAEKEISAMLDKIAKAHGTPAPAPKEVEPVKPKPSETLAMPTPEVTTGEQTVRDIPAAEQPKTITNNITQHINRAVGSTTAAQVLSDKRDASPMELAKDIFGNLKEMFGDRQNWFKSKKEPELIEKRESLEKLSDLSPEEIKRLEERGVAPSSENDFSYRRDGKPLSKEQLVEELNTDADEKNTKAVDEYNAPKPFYKKRIEKLTGEYNTRLKERLAKRMPLLRLFTDKLDPTEKNTGDGTPATEDASGGGGVGGGFDLEATGALKSIDGNIQQILDILKDNQTEEKADDKKAEEKAEDAKEEKTEQQTAAALDELEQRELSNRSRQSHAESVDGEEEDNSNSFVGKAKKGMKKLKEGFGKIKEKFGGGQSAAAEGVEAEAVGSAAGEGLGAGAGEAAGVGLGEAAGIGLGEAGGALAGAEAGAAAGSVVPVVGTAIGAVGGMLLGSLLGNMFAKGGVVNKMTPFNAFADGGVVDSPTMFSHEDGAGVMGEAGPEAIIPLKRGTDGELGVKMQADPIDKNPISPQTSALEQAEEQRRVAEKRNDSASSGKSPTIINNNMNTNNNQSGGGGGGMVATAGPRNSLDLNYYAQ